MNEKLYDPESQPIEPLNVDINDLITFKQNKCPIDLKTNNYEKLKYHFGTLKEKKIFDKSEISQAKDISYIGIFISFVFCFSFYMLLLTYLLSHNTLILIYLIIVYVLGLLLQLSSVPVPANFKTKTDFENDFNKLLNSYVLFKLTDGKDTKQAWYQAKYCIDITGENNIPKDYNYVKINGIQLFAKKDLDDLCKQFKEVYKRVNVEYGLYYNDEKIEISEFAYAIGPNADLYSINCFHTLYSILQIQWIYAIYSLCIKSNKCIVLYPAKLITDSFITSPSKFNIHNTKYQVPQYINIPIENNTQFEDDYSNYQREKREKEERDERAKKLKEERKRKLKENTTELSTFKNGKNFKIKVKKVYDDVVLRFDAYENKNHTWYETELGPYDPNIKERIERLDKTTIYHPKGFDVRIEVIRGLYSYTITIGDEYTKNFSYKD